MELTKELQSGLSSFRWETHNITNTRMEHCILIYDGNPVSAIHFGPSQTQQTLKYLNIIEWCMIRTF
jgi:hypothetical protein